MEMKKNKLLSSLIAVFMAVVLFAPSSALAAAFGVSPPWIENDNIKPGSNFVYVINLSANDLSSVMKVQSEFDGDPEIAQWLTIRDRENLTMTTGKNTVPMSVNVRIPEGTPVGRYEGSIRIALEPTNGKTGSITTLLGGNIAVKLNVIDYDVVDYKVSEITVDPIVEGQSITLGMVIKNEGNTEITNVPVKASIVDIKSDALMLNSSADNIIVTVPPHIKGATKLSLPMRGLTSGKYWLDLEAAQSDGSAYINRLHLEVKPGLDNNTVSTDVKVVPEGWIKAAAPSLFGGSSSANVETSVKVRAPLTNQLIIVMIGILLILTGIVGKFYMTFKKKRR